MSKPLASARKRMGVENTGEVSALRGTLEVAKEIFGDTDGAPIAENFFLRLDTAASELGEDSPTDLSQLLMGLRIESADEFFRRFWGKRVSAKYHRDVSDFSELSKVIEDTVGTNSKLDDFQMKTEGDNLLVYSEVVYDGSYDVQIYAAYLSICDALDGKGYVLGLSEVKDMGDGNTITTCTFRHPEMPGRTLTAALDLNESSGGSLQNSILLAWRINPKETDK